jgi:hypothetical protein
MGGRDGVNALGNVENGEGEQNDLARFLPACMHCPLTLLVWKALIIIRKRRRGRELLSFIYLDFPDSFHCFVESLSLYP